MFDTIKIGDRLEITLYQNKTRSKSYVSQVEDIYTNNELLIHTPVSYGQLVKLSTTELYSMLFFTDRGMTDFKAEIIGHKKIKDFNYMIVRITSEGERVQRREFFRYTCLLPLKFAVVDEAEGAKQAGPMLDGIIKDLGGGGVRFVTNESLDESNQIRCVIMLGDQCVVTAGKILHKQFFPKSNYQYQYRLEFSNTTAAEKEEIVQFIFREQRKESQKAK